MTGSSCAADLPGRAALASTLCRKSSASNTGRISTSAPPSNGARFSHSTASSIDFTCQIQKPEIKFLRFGERTVDHRFLRTGGPYRFPFDEG